jgi:hypothetical protein
MQVTPAAMTVLVPGTELWENFCVPSDYAAFILCSIGKFLAERRKRAEDIGHCTTRIQNGVGGPAECQVKEAGEAGVP